ncbi:hypothetical protein HYALB_00004221 [Hymenoscyphus albidus]|uniref:SMP-30/Gluconolactonase/LRE-like region domain-containing protein n=1 Tax=Hymenoscyphus albidus TaxID=595503 RepID=A0A9N9Q3C3_9HELO|nr:hypothetical protein HYALB_00004221 [Hymenoscyphus albidus]
MTDHLTKNGGDVWYRNPTPNTLGESPIYRESDSTLHWIDILAKPCTVHILKIDPTTGDAIGSARVLEVPLDSIHALYFRRDVKGSYIVAYRQGIAFLDEQTGAIEVVKKLIGDEEQGMNSNDAGVDPQGRFWLGDVDASAFMKGTEPRGKLWRYDPDGSCTVMDTGVICGNGIGWSPDSKYMYFNDTGPKVVWRYDFDGKTGDISNKTKLIEGTDFPQGGGNDGMVIDETGNLWIAMWGMNEVRVYSPEGKLLQSIQFPAKCMTCTTWGGKDNDILFVTSAIPFTGPEAGDEGGHVFRYKPGVKGLPKYSFAG